ncbi:hypothetical protein [Chitinophaga sp. Cy-1792]|uniref:hypothetical protein n=1 Tax=Chitinophaga sp. Cy-1792 TaxID=2608339 RepID=UPI0014219CE4|nr:hypothetical protein [Chitinophaga sp. Cy-1792]
MKPVNPKKIKLGVIKIAPMNGAHQGEAQGMKSNSSCGHVCPTICSQNCPTFLCF